MPNEPTKRQYIVTHTQTQARASFRQLGNQTTPDIRQV